MFSLAQKSRSEKKGTTQTPQQLHLLAAALTEARAKLKTVISTKLASASWPGSQCDRYWISCNYVSKYFSGLFNQAEVDYVLARSKKRMGLIEPREFDQTTNLTVAVSAKRVAV